MYLTRELAALGHEVHVLTADVYAGRVYLDDPDGVIVHRSFAGPVRGLLAWLVQRKQPQTAPAGPGQPATGPRVAPPPRHQPSELNWKGRLVERFKDFAEWAVFPDLRGEWKWSARRRLRQLLEEVRPDVLVSSHEPATTLELGLGVAGEVKWVADIADPVLALYTPWRWRRRSRRLESATWRKADLVLFTNTRAAELLAARHGPRGRPWRVVPQGFDDRTAPVAGPAPAPGVELELLYTGSFYSFRAPDELLHAVAATPGVRLSIASSGVPPVVRHFAETHPDSVRLLGFLGHRQALEAQRAAHVLVNIANADPSQIPGKFNEYLGAARPVLHIAADGGQDLAAAFVQRTGRGWVVENDRQQIADRLAVLLAQRDQPHFGAQVRHEDADAFGWSRIARELAGDLAGATAEAGR